MPITSIPAAAEGMSKVSRADVMRAAWAQYRVTSALLGNKGRTFSRARFALALRLAWSNAKLVAFYAQQEAERASEAPAVASARNELLDLRTKDRWTGADYAREYELHAAIAA